MRPSCQTSVYVFVKISSRRLITLSSHLPLLCCEPLFFPLSLCATLQASFFCCLLTHTSHLLLLLKVLIPRFSVELLRQTEAAALSFASELKETEEKERDRREKRGRCGGADSSMFKEGVLSGASGRMSGVPVVYMRDTSHSLGVSVCTH